MSYERQNGTNGGFTTGLGATTGLTLQRAPAGTFPALPPAQALPMPGASAPQGSPIGKILVIGGLGVGAFLLYRHFKKKGGGGSAPEPAP